MNMKCIVYHVKKLPNRKLKVVMEYVEIKVLISLLIQVI
nr:MAG TPA: protein of unknown function (DUF4851) [Caudoviricetes sp.]